jgi:hypothetical protein
VNNTGPLNGVDKEFIVTKIQMLIEFIMAFNLELVESLSDPNFAEQKEHHMLAWQDDCRTALEAVGEAIGREIMQSNSRGTN